MTGGEFPVRKSTRPSVLGQSIALLVRHPIDCIVFTLVSLAPGFAILALVDYVFLRGALEGSRPSRLALAVAGYGQSVATILLAVLTAGFASVLVLQTVKAHIDGRAASLGAALRGLGPQAARLTAALLVSGLLANISFVVFPPLGLLVMFLLCQVPQVFSDEAPRFFHGLWRSVILVLRAPLETGLVLGLAFIYLMIATVLRYAVSIPAAVTMGYLGVQVVFGLCILPVVTWTLVALNVIYLRSTATQTQTVRSG